MKWDRSTRTARFAPIMWTKTLLERLGLQVDLHKFVGRDDDKCFHTHPAYALRIVLAGGYVEELEDGRLIAWRAGDLGLVRPSTSHRIESVLYGRPAYTLWIRGPKVAKIELRGTGWPQGTAWRCAACDSFGMARELLDDSEACPGCGSDLTTKTRTDGDGAGT